MRFGEGSFLDELTVESYYCQNMWNSILTYTLGLISGRFVAFGDAYLRDIVDRKKELRDNLRKPYQQISETIANGQQNWYKVPPTKARVARTYKLAAYVESYGKRNLANDIRQLVRNWMDYSDSIKKMKKDAPIEYHIRQMELRVECDNRADFIMEELAKDYTIFPSFLLKVKRFYTFQVLGLFQKILRLLKMILSTPPSKKDI